MGEGGEKKRGPAKRPVEREKKAKKRLVGGVFTFAAKGSCAEKRRGELSTSDRFCDAGKGEEKIQDLTKVKGKGGGISAIFGNIRYE